MLTPCTAHSLQCSLMRAGDNSVSNTDTTQWSEADVAWLRDLSSYVRNRLSRPGRQASWFWWTWQANSRECI